ncbi:RNA polymerase sigma factor [Halalkalibacter akibai]|uniref:RNA polymerase sigma factor n=1 Tax=Halalkalibacter akibai (strain ATCC 43226 / DSM 21942 / CIP 109018 / JCM 9157 / 1139) TaxID=1236973 RepID=W4QSB6_HALA3|nr:RNA polymerase sigma factor [Halalkalibacter akibai]GAE35000.1 RNA polymerase sigma-70 factor [Halalkalibacter akibai JCM 9157]
MSDDKQQVITEWYSQYSQSIYSYILLMTREQQLAEDLTQETFIKAYRYYDSFKGDSSSKTWLFTIARNTTVDYVRARKPVNYLKELLSLKKEKGPLPDEVVQIKETSRELYDALSQLKKSYRDVIILRKLKEFSTKETAMILNCSESKVKSTLSRAIPALEKQLLKEGYLHENSI